MWSWLAIGLSGMYSVMGSKQDNRTQFLVFKIFTLLLLLILVATQDTLSAYTYWITGGLLVSILADTLSSLKVHSMIYFSGYLIAQACYSTAFWVQLNIEIVWWLLALLLAASIVAFFLLLPLLDNLVFPVVIMGIMLVQMAGAAGEVWLQTASYSKAIGFLGTLVMIYSALSYAVLSYRKPKRFSHSWANGSYLLAHALIVASIIY
ncbi:lysoplasmalogenase family protein [Vibrio mytili]|uniref:lysoplasmalogenase n=1 Tax=Vibrio mytili TaxID=50718 RepID=UPI002F3F8E78